MNKIISSKDDWLNLRASVETALLLLKQVNAAQLSKIDKSDFLRAVACLGEASVFFDVIESFSTTENLREKALKIKKLNGTTSCGELKICPSLVDCDYADELDELENG